MCIPLQAGKKVLIVTHYMLLDYFLFVPFCCICNQFYNIILYASEYNETIFAFQISKNTPFAIKLITWGSLDHLDFW